MSYKKRFPKPKFLKSLNRLLIVITIFAVLLVGLMAIAFAIQNRFTNPETNATGNIINALILALPIELFILSIIASLIFVSRLGKKSIYVQDISSIEAFSLIDILCVNKEGSLTNGELEIKKIIPLTAFATEPYIAQWVSNALRATDDHNLVTDALRKEFDLQLSAGVVSTATFKEGRQYFGASFKGEKTIMVGSAQYIPIKNSSGILKRCEEYINNGQRVLVVAEGKERIVDNEYPDELNPIALIVLKDCIRKDAFETFKWFKDNGIAVKVISSRDTLATSAIAAEAGIENANNSISLEGMSIEEVKKIAFDYTVFAKANAEQKEALINAFKHKNKKVAMVGDNYSELLAMKRADCAIAVDNVDDDVKKKADIVLADESLSSLTLTINEGRRLTNNLQKIAALYMAKIIFVLALVFSTLISTLFNNVTIYFLFTFSNFIPLTILIDFVAALFLIFEKNSKKMRTTFLRGVFRKAIPASLLMVAAISLVVASYVLQGLKFVNFGIYSIEAVVTMSTIIITVIGLVYLYSICSPLNKYRAIILTVCSFVSVLALVVTALITYLTKQSDPVLQTPYLEMSGPAYMVTAIIILVFSAIYIFVHKLNLIRKGDNIENEN